MRNINVNEMIGFDSRRIFIAVATEEIAGKMNYGYGCNKKLLKKVITFCNTDIIRYLGECGYYDTKELFSMTYDLLYKSNKHILGKCEASEIQGVIERISNFIKIIENIV